MGKQQPPDPVGALTAFPYQLLWEEFGRECESLLDPEDDDAIRLFESLRGQLRRPAAYSNFSREAVAASIAQSNPELAKRNLLVDRLFRLGAAYLVPRMQRELGLGSAKAKEDVAHLAKAVEQLMDRLAVIDINLLLTIQREGSFQQMLRGDPVQSQDPLGMGRLSGLMHTLVELSEGAAVVAEEIPVLPQARSVDVLTRRLVRDAATLLKQAGAGPFNFPRSAKFEPATAGAHLLWDFLKLLDRQLSGQTVHNVLKANGLHTSRPVGRPREELAR